MEIAGHLLSKNLRRLIGLVLAAAFLMASFGFAHAMPMSSSHQHPVERACLQEGLSHHADLSQAPDCAENAAQKDQDEPTRHGAIGSCCVVTCSPTIPVAVFSEFVIVSFSMIRLSAHVDRFAGLDAPDGLFRPPRARA